jgi:hypothetical protein
MVMDLDRPDGVRESVQIPVNSRDRNLHIPKMLWALQHVLIFQDSAGVAKGRMTRSATKVSNA